MVSTQNATELLQDMLWSYSHDPGVACPFNVDIPNLEVGKISTFLVADQPHPEDLALFLMLHTIPQIVEAIQIPSRSGDDTVTSFEAENMILSYRAVGVSQAVCGISSVQIKTCTLFCLHESVCRTTATGGLQGSSRTQRCLTCRRAQVS
jgi:hypothetical protein